MVGQSKYNPICVGTPAVVLLAQVVVVVWANHFCIISDRKDFLLLLLLLHVVFSNPRIPYLKGK